MVAGGAGAEQDKGEARKSLICSNYCPDSQNTQLYKSVTFCFDSVDNVM